MSKPEKLTIVLDHQTRAELREWATEDGNRSLCSLVRKIVSESLAQRRHQEAPHHV